MKTNKNTPLRRLQELNKNRVSICPVCSMRGPVTVDHIIPVHFMEQMGLFDEILHDAENFQLLCKTCNHYKGHRLDFSNKNTLPLLKKYIRILKSKAGDNPLT